MFFCSQSEEFTWKQVSKINRWLVCVDGDLVSGIFDRCTRSDNQWQRQTSSSLCHFWCSCKPSHILAHKDIDDETIMQRSVWLAYLICCGNKTYHKQIKEASRYQQVENYLQIQIFQNVTTLPLQQSFSSTFL